jgi:hypothetical protein
MGIKTARIPYTFFAIIPPPPIGDKMSNTVKLHHDTIPLFKDLDLCDSRFINSSLLRIDQREKFTDEQYIPVDLHLYASLCGITLKKSYNQVLSIANKLRDTSFTLDLSNGYKINTSLVYEVIYTDDPYIVKINWNRKFIPYISGNMRSGTFITIDPITSTIKSQKRYSLYLLIHKSLWKLGQNDVFYITKADIRLQANVQEGEYKEYKELNRTLLQPTLKDIGNKLGIHLKTKVVGDRVEFRHDI